MVNIEYLKSKYPRNTRIQIELEDGDSILGWIKKVDNEGYIHAETSEGEYILNEELDVFRIYKEKDYLTVLYIEPGKTPRKLVIAHKGEEMSKLVGGSFEIYMPFFDNVAIVCNEEGMHSGFRKNRAVYDSSGALLDVIYGPFFITGADLYRERFFSLGDIQLKKYGDMFFYPEKFIEDSQGLRAIKVKNLKEDNK